MKKDLFKLKFYSILILLALAVSAVGCKTTFPKAAKVFDSHPKESAEYCGTKFPVKPFTKTTTKYLPGKRDTVKGQTEYVTINCDSAVKVKTKIVKAPCPPNSIVTIRDTLLVHDTTSVENTAISEGLHMELTDCIAAKEKAEKQAATRLHWAFAGWGISLLLIAFLALLFTGKIR